MTVDHTMWMGKKIDGLSDHIHHMSPSEFVESERYLPAHVSRYPGPYRFSVNPYMREIVDCFDIRSDVREVNLMKGVQITYTTVAECVLFYAAAHLKTYPCQWLSNDDGNARKRLDKNIVPMFMNSGWDHILQANDATNVRKQGVTRDQMSWIGGGYVLVHGVQTSGKLRQDSIMFQIKDELDAWPDFIGKDGEPDKVSSDRCAAYWEVRKQFRGSTPLLSETSKIYKQYLRGDQRHYFVKCIGCGHAQFLKWRGVNKETGLVYGIAWEMNDLGLLVQESVCYVCSECGHKHYEYDKDVLFSPDHGAEWRATADPVEPGIRSYKLPALYSPIGMQPWHKSASSWLEAWDVENNRPRDVGVLQVFYNNVLAEPFVMVGEKVRLSAVTGHRRRAYDRGEVPNKFAEAYAGSNIGLLIMSVDVQKDWLAVGIWGFTRGNRVFLIDYIEIEGETEMFDAGAWLELAKIVEFNEWIADDGKSYRVTITLVDAAYRTDTVHNFCAQFSSGVIAIQGRAQSVKGATVKEFNAYTTKLGTRAFNITVDLYKDRMAARLRREWNGQDLMPEGMFNAPMNTMDRELKHLTVEYKRQKKNVRTGQPMGFEWYRPGNARQELWDLLIYAVAGLDILAWDMLIEGMEREAIEWGEFWDIVLGDELYYSQ